MSLLTMSYSETKSAASFQRNLVICGDFSVQNGISPYSLLEINGHVTIFDFAMLVLGRQDSKMMYKWQ